MCFTVYDLSFKRLPRQSPNPDLQPRPLSFSSQGRHLTCRLPILETSLWVLQSPFSLRRSSSRIDLCDSSHKRLSFVLSFSKKRSEPRRACAGRVETGISFCNPLIRLHIQHSPFDESLLYSRTHPKTRLFVA